MCSRNNSSQELSLLTRLGSTQMQGYNYNKTNESLLLITMSFTMLDCTD